MSATDHDRRLRALDEFLSAYEAEHGAIADREIEEAASRARSRTIVVTGAKPAAGDTLPRT
jgi:hypothetical protein